MDRTQVGEAISERYGRFTEMSVKTPNIAALKKLKMPLPVNDYLWSRFDVRQPYTPSFNGMVCESMGRGFRPFTSCVNQGYLDTMTGVTVPIQDKGNAVAIVSNRLLSKVRSTPVDLAVALGEYRETAAFVSTVVRKIVKSGKQLKRGNISGALRTLTGEDNRHWTDVPTTASGMWLAYSYAVRPLLGDVYGAIEALANSKRPYVPVHISRSSKTFQISGDAQSPDGRFKSSCKGTLTVSGEVRFVVSNPLTRSLDELGLTNPLLVAWELVPFSFVADWFIPVGRYLSEVVPPQGVDLVSGWISTKTVGGVTNRTFVDLGPEYQPPVNTILTSVEVEKTRTKLTTFPKYTLVVPDVSLSKEQVASSLALLWSLFGGKERP